MTITFPQFNNDVSYIHTDGQPYDVVATIQQMFGSPTLCYTSRKLICFEGYIYNPLYNVETQYEQPNFLSHALFVVVPNCTEAEKQKLFSVAEKFSATLYTFADKEQALAAAKNWVKAQLAERA